MIVKVRMCAFHDPVVVRPVFIEDRAWRQLTQLEAKLELIFHQGQNDVQPVEGVCSVSMGDVIELDDKLFLVRPVGFKLIDEDEYKTYLDMPRRDRHFYDPKGKTS